MLTANDTIQVVVDEAGVCKRGDLAQVVKVEEYLNWHNRLRVTLRFNRTGKTFILETTQLSRLSGSTFRLNDARGLSIWVMLYRRADSKTPPAKIRAPAKVDSF